MLIHLGHRKLMPVFSACYFVVKSALKQQKETTSKIIHLSLFLIMNTWNCFSYFVPLPFLGVKCQATTLLIDLGITNRHKKYTNTQTM